MASKRAKHDDSNIAPEDAIAIIGDYAGVLLFQSARIMERTLLERLAAEGFGDLRRRHSALAGHMLNEGIRTTTLAEKTGMTKQAVGMLVSELEEMDIVERIPDPSDMRAKLVVFTRRGQSFLETVSRLMPEVEAEMRDMLGKSDLQVMKRALRKIAASARP